MHSVLVVDDDQALRRVIRAWVESAGFQASEAEDADSALHALEARPVDIAVCDVNMPGWSGVWLAEQIRERFPRTAIVMATAARDVETAIASLRNQVVDYILKPFDRTRLLEALALGRDWHSASISIDQFHHAMEDRLRQRRASVAAQLAEAQDSVRDAWEGLMAVLQLHVHDSRDHALRVAHLALALADQLELKNGSLERLEQAALLHDVGKLEMPASILSKPAPLDDHEWRVMRTHPQAGYDLLKKQPRFADAAEIVLCHHEAFDGSGYPRGLTGEAIPIEARILAVADAYDSMTQPHTQRPAMSPALAVNEIERCSGRQFDPDCAEALGPVLLESMTKETVV
jgi:putative nucleotidyltransferase with HDIG domain